MAAAATPPADTDLEQRCAADSKQYCPELGSGDPKLFKCLHRNEANVSRDISQKCIAPRGFSDEAR
jgi:hypothetical protein